MRKCEEVRKSMKEEYEEVWGSMKKYVEVWKSMKKHYKYEVNVELEDDDELEVEADGILHVELVVQLDVKVDAEELLPLHSPILWENQCAVKWDLQSRSVLSVQC